MKTDSKQLGTRITALRGNDQLLYFTSSSLAREDKTLVFLSDRTGSPNLFRIDLATSEETQLTRHDEGLLKSYVYFDGLPYRGFGKASVSLDSQRGQIYYIHGREIRVVNLEGRGRVLAELPPRQMTAFTHISHDGSRLCVPTTDARALDDERPLPARLPGYDVDGRVQEEALSSYLRIYETATGREIETVPVPKAWVTHVQFSPVDASLILYNHEWASFDTGIRRMWMWDGRRHLPLRSEGGTDGPWTRSRHDWVCHEMWERDGSALIYHGSYHNGPAFLGRMRADGTGVREIALPDDWKQYGHFTVGRPNQLVSDGYYQTPETAGPGNGRWIAGLQVDWDAGKIEWHPLCQHGSSWASQDA
ncbi:MAG TPA: hypothetical protein VIM71_12020, partial [Lacunisphaera sp.]